MPSDLPILVVDDAKFSATIIMRSLEKGGYTNVKHATSAKEALEIHKNNPVSIVIADWLMPEMDGVEMTKRIRQYEETTHRFTYVIMLTARDGIEPLKHAFDEGVDDFVNKQAMQTQLLPRVFAAERIVNNYNRLLRENDELLLANRTLEQNNIDLRNRCTIDFQTGTGTYQYARSKLESNLKQTQSRGGATCYLQINVQNIQALERKYPAPIISELMVSLSRRLKNLVRPLDDISRMGHYSFSVITHQPDISLCEGNSFQRILKAINTKAFQTTMGYEQLTVHMVVVAACPEYGMPNAQQLLDMAESKIANSGSPHRIEHFHYREVYA